MSSRVHVSQGIATSVYDDRWFPLLAKLGSAEVTRATDIEWSHAYRTWVARELATGHTIATGPNRALVVSQEVDYLETKLGEL